MKDMRILCNQGRIIAINKCGKWEPLNGVTRYDVAQAIQSGYVENYVDEEKVTTADVIDFFLTLAICIAVLMVGIVFFNA